MCSFYLKGYLRFSRVAFATIAPTVQTNRAVIDLVFIINPWLLGVTVRAAIRKLIALTAWPAAINLRYLIYNAFSMHF